MSLTPSTPGQKGFLVISMDTGAVLSSGGDLQSDDKTAAILYNIVKTSAQLELVRQVSVSYSDHSYTIVISGSKLHVAKREAGDGVEPVLV